MKTIIIATLAAIMATTSALAASSVVGYSSLGDNKEIELACSGEVKYRTPTWEKVLSLGLAAEDTTLSLERDSLTASINCQDGHGKGLTVAKELYIYAPDGPYAPVDFTVVVYQGDDKKGLMTCWGQVNYQTPTWKRILSLGAADEETTLYMDGSISAMEIACHDGQGRNITIRR